MNKSIKGQQGGFTLIELIVVIVILGILAATALPRFSNLSGDARLASLNAARGALNATSAMTHGRWMVDRAATQNVEGVVVAMNASSGYPEIGATQVGTTGVTETEALMRAAGLDQDYVATNRTGEVRIVPRAAANTAAATTCFVTYTQATAVNTVPTVTVTGNGDACQ